MRKVIKDQNKLQLGSFTVVSEIENDHVMKSFLNMERYILVFCVVYLVCIESSGANFILDCQNQFKVVKYEGKYKMIISSILPIYDSETYFQTEKSNLMSYVCHPVIC